MTKIACAAIVKNEAAHVAEWIAYQYAVGFDTVILFDNASTDGTVFEALNFSDRCDIRIVDWPLTTPDYQTKAYDEVVRRFGPEFDWIAFFDTDEFLVLDEGLALKPVLEARGDAAAVAVPWAFFGSSGHGQKPDGLIIESFQHRGSPAFHANEHVKSIVRPSRAKACRNPHFFEVDGSYRLLNGEAPVWKRPGILQQASSWPLGKLHHYFTRSRDHWAEKMARGYHDTARDPDVFAYYDRNEEFDAGACRLAPAVRALMGGGSIAKPAPAPAVQTPPLPGPAPEASASPAKLHHGGPVHGICLVACARWETPYIAEWLTYHRMIGFDHVYLYCNDDDPTALYEAVLPFIAGGNPYVTFNHEPVQGRQPEMYGHFLANYKDETAWFGFLDIDEFIVLKTDPDIKALIARFADRADLIFFNWLNFGTSGNAEAASGSVLRNYTRRESSFHQLTKFVVAAAKFPAAASGTFWHDPSPIAPALRMVNPIGIDMRGYTQAAAEGPGGFVENEATGERLIDTAYIAHYAFKSRAAFLQRKARGLGGSFVGQGAWADLHDSPQFEHFLTKIDSVEDATLKRFWETRLGAARLPGPRAILPVVDAAVPRLGIAITTLNRRDTVLEVVARIQRFTTVEYDLVVCDDGSSDGTVAALRAEGVTVIAGSPRGIAWNKNRGLYHLLNRTRCDVVLLLDDDIAPDRSGWQAAWIEASSRYGHINHLHPAYHAQVVSGTATVDDPGLTTRIPGWALGFSRAALAQIGYFDVRFGRYGHEHTDFTERAIRAGYGGVLQHNDNSGNRLFYVIDGGLKGLPSKTSGTEEETAANAQTLGLLMNEPVYRHAWRSDEQMRAFLPEVIPGWTPPLGPVTDAPPPADLQILSRYQPATQSSVSEWSRAPTPSRDAAGAVNGLPDGRRKFHTARESNPWWQVDLGDICGIGQVRIYNTTDHTAQRFRRFSLSVSDDGAAFREIFRKTDHSVVGGVGSTPFIFEAGKPVAGRYCRVTLLGEECLHLDQVEVYGRSSTAGPTKAGATRDQLGEAALMSRIYSLDDH